MSFVINSPINRGVFTRSVEKTNQLYNHSPKLTYSRSQLQQHMKLNASMHTGQKHPVRYNQQRKLRLEADEIQHCRILDCMQVEPLKDYQIGTSSPSNRNQSKIQQADSTLTIDGLKRIVNHKDVLANQLHHNVYSQYLNPIIHMTNIVKIMEKIYYEKIDVTNIIKTAYLTEQGRNMLHEYCELKYGCVGPTHKQQRQSEELKVNIDKAKKQLKDLQQIIQYKKGEAANLQSNINANNQHLKRAQAEFNHYKSNTTQELQHLTQRLRKEQNKEQQRKEEIIKQRIKQQEQHQRMSLRNDSIKKQYEKHVQLGDKAKKQWQQYQKQRDHLSEQCKQLKKSIDQITKAIDREGVKLAENRSLAQALKEKEALLKSVNEQIGALSYDVLNKELQIVKLKTQLECKAQQGREAKVDTLKATIGKNNIIYNLTEENRKLIQKLDALKQANADLQKVQKQLVLDMTKMQQNYNEQLEKVKHLKEIQEENALLRELNQKLVNQINVSSSIIRDIRNKERLIDQLKKQLERKEQQVLKAKKEASKAATERDNKTRQYIAQNKSLSQRLKAIQSEINMHLEKKQQWQKTQSELHDRLGNAKEEVQLLRLKIDDLSHEKSSLQYEIKSGVSTQTDKESFINGALQEQKRKQETIDALQKENIVLNIQIKNKQVQLRDTSEKAAEFFAAFEKLVVQHKALEENIFNKDKIIDNLTQNQSTLQDKFNALQIQYSGIGQKSTALTQQRSYLQNKLQKVQKQLDSIAMIKTRLEHKIGKMDEKIKEMSEQIEKQIQIIQQKEQLIKSLQAKNEQNDHSLQTFKKQNQEAEHTLKNSIENLDVSVQDYQTKMKMFDQAVLALQSKHKQQLKNMKKEVQAHLIKKMAEFKGEIDNLKTQNKQLIKQNNELKFQNNRLKEQQRNEKEQREQIGRVQSAVPSSAEVQTCVVLEPQFSNSQQGAQLQIVQIKDQGVKCHNNDELDRALEKIKRLQNEIQEKQEQINEMRIIMDEERIQIDALKSMIKESNQQEQPSQPTEEEIRRQPSQGKDLAKKLQQKENQLNDLIEGTQQLNINYNELLQDYQMLEQENNKLKQQAYQIVQLRVSNDKLKQANNNLKKDKQQLTQTLSRTQQKYKEQLARVKHLQGIQHPQGMYEENAFLKELNQKPSKQVYQLNVSGSIVEEQNNQQGEKSQSMILKSVISNPELNEIEEEQQLLQNSSIERIAFHEVVDLLEVEQQFEKESSKMGCKKCQALERKIKKMVHQLFDPESIE